MFDFELKFRPNPHNSLIGSCTCQEILNSSPFLIGYNISKTQVNQEYIIDELNLYFDSSLNKQITKQYILSRCYNNHIESKL